MATETTPTSSSNNTNRNKDITLSEKKASGSIPGGKITLDENVVATIAGMCAKEVEGIHELGRPRLIPFGTGSVTRGVDVEVGNKQAAVDLDVIVEYGTDLEKCASTLRSRLAAEIDKMANREVVEVNVHVADIHLPESEDNASSAKEEPRVI